MKLIRLVFLAAAAATLAASCDPEEEKINYSESVAGTYSGYATAEFQYSPTPMVSTDQSLTVTEVTEETVTVNYTSDTWGTFTIEDATVTESNGTYTISGSGKTVMGMSADSQSEYDCTLTATITSDSDFSFEFDVPAVMGGLVITMLPGNPPMEMTVSGTYSGTLALSVMGQDQGTAESTVTVAAEDGKATLTLTGFGMAGMSIEDIAIPDVVLVETDGGCTLSAENIDVVAGDINVTGSLEGTIDNGNAGITFVLKPGAMPMDVTAVFTGSK